jgi:hypothetical protein
MHELREQMGSKEQEIYELKELMNNTAYVV